MSPHTSTVYTTILSTILISLSQQSIAQSLEINSKTYARSIVSELSNCSANISLHGATYIQLDTGNGRNAGTGRSLMPISAALYQTAKFIGLNKAAMSEKEIEDIANTYSRQAKLQNERDLMVINSGESQAIRRVIDGWGQFLKGCSDKIQSADIKPIFQKIFNEISNAR